MKRKLVRIAGVLLGLLLIVGIACCILRPEYTNEAMNILFDNELNIEDMISE